MGYSRAGFEVVGIDKGSQKHYPFEFHQADALEYLAEHGREFDVIHASPPCQGYSRLRMLPGVKEYPKLVEAVRNLLFEIGKPYIIENVVLAPLIDPVMLCGTMFGLPLIRHRIFETNPRIYFLPFSHQCRKLYTASFYGGASHHSSFANGAKAICVVGNSFNTEDGKQAMGIDWMTHEELAEAIPPMYTEFIGRELLEAM